MNCSTYKLFISAQLDGQIKPSERVLLTHHLNECGACRQCALDLRSQGQALRELRALSPSPEQAAGMQAATLWALQLEARKQSQQIRWRAEQQLNWRIKLFSRSFAAIASLLLFFMLVTSILQPAYRAFNVAKVAAQTVIQPDTSDEEIAQLKDLLLPPPPSPRPILDPRGTLIGFTREVPDEEFTVIAWVGADGKALVKEVIEAPQNPDVINKLSTALTQQANFKPAFRRGKFMPANAVLMFSRITIIG